MAAKRKGLPLGLSVSLLLAFLRNKEMFPPLVLKGMVGRDFFGYLGDVPPLRKALPEFQVVLS